MSRPEGELRGPLTGITVLDLTRVAAGPFATMLLADMGADVIKIERPGTGDDSRTMDISFRGGESGYYLGLNKNKRSIAVDLQSAEGVEIVKGLARGCDVIAENFRPGVADRLGIGYEAIRDIRPDVIYCSISGFGDSGPLREKIAYDIIAQAMSGIMSITGETDGSPAKCGAPIADLSSGVFAALGILAALLHRAETGEGQRVSTSLLGATSSLLSSYVTSRALGTPFHRVGSAHNTLAPYQAFAGADGKYFIVAVGNDSFWAKVARALGLEELIDDPRYATNAERTKRRDELAERLQEAFLRRTAAEWLGLLEAAGVPVGPIYELDEMIAEPQMRENGYLEDVEIASGETIPMLVAPLTFSRTPVGVRMRPPMLDEHRDEILGRVLPRQATA